MRLDAINELFDDILSKTDGIKAVYDKSKKDETIEKIKNPIIKNALENLRSILDYSACDIYEFVYKINVEKNGKKVYFPYSDTKSKFKVLLLIFTARK